VCNEHVWDDDQQIVWLSGSKRWTEDGEDPHILMVITPAE
jgi:Holliday junction resolvase RusA-like endonuclease